MPSKPRVGGTWRHQPWQNPQVRLLQISTFLSFKDRNRKGDNKYKFYESHIMGSTVKYVFFPTRYHWCGMSLLVRIWCGLGVNVDINCMYSY